MGGIRGMGGMGGIRGIGGIGGIGGMKFDFFIRQVQNIGHTGQIESKGFWVKDGLKMEFWGNGCA